ncbi:MAG: prepilin peptidase [Polyangiaceae bacterium]|nr:prepilin peptidase [Polyangiaceae bacterium]
MLVSDFPEWFLVTTAVSLGLVFGSFLNVVIYRLPRGENVAFPGSRCPACGSPIRGYDNVPVLSFILLRGRARCCRARISIRYPLVELAGGLFAWSLLDLLLLDRAGDTPFGIGAALFAAYLALGLGLIAAAFIDVEHMVLPDEITMGGALLGVVTAPLRSDLAAVASAPWAGTLAPLGAAAVAWGDSVFGALVGFLGIWLPFDLLYRHLRGRTGMAQGDAKLVMLAGAWFGWPGALFALVAGAVQGTLGSAALLLTRGRIEEPPAVREERAALRAAIEAADGEERAALQAELDGDPLGTEPDPGALQTRIPFGPFLVLAILEYLFFGPALVARYLDWALP